MPILVRVVLAGTADLLLGLADGLVVGAGGDLDATAVIKAMGGGQDRVISLLK